MGGLYNPPVVSDSEGLYLIRHSATQLSVWLKQKKNKYVVYDVRRDDNVSRNVSVWRIFNAKVTDIVEVNPITNRTEVNPLTITLDPVQWEYAFLINGAPDFFGGYHGDEQVQSVLFIVDGKAIASDASLLTSALCNRFELVQHTICYDPNDGVTKAGDMYVRHIWTKDGLQLKFKFVWANNYALGSCYGAMLPCLRGATTTTKCRLINGDANDTTIYDISTTEHGRPGADVKGIELWNDTNNLGMALEFEDMSWFNNGADTTARGLWVTDSASYNKVYPARIHAATTSAVTAGEEWTLSAFYRIFFND